MTGHAGSWGGSFNICLDSHWTVPVFKKKKSVSRKFTKIYLNCTKWSCFCKLFKCRIWRLWIHKWNVVQIVSGTPPFRLALRTSTITGLLNIQLHKDFLAEISHPLCSINQYDTVDGWNLANHLGCMKPYEQWDKLPTSTGAGFQPSTVVSCHLIVRILYQARPEPELRNTGKVHMKKVLFHDSTGENQKW